MLCQKNFDRFLPKHIPQGANLTIPFAVVDSPATEPPRCTPRSRGRSPDAEAILPIQRNRHPVQHQAWTQALHMGGNKRLRPTPTLRLGDTEASFVSRNRHPQYRVPVDSYEVDNRRIALRHFAAEAQ